MLKFLKWFLIDQFTFGFGGGGGGGPTSSTTVTSNIPEYAEPYVTNMLDITQQQLFNIKPGATANDPSQITGFKGYQPYSSDVRNYVAGFSPLQQQAQYEAGAMQQPGQFALGSGLTGSAGIRSLGVGNQYAQNVTSPESMRAYMSPYQQNVTDLAISAANREAQIKQKAQNLGAVRQGTYGSARQLLANTELDRNLQSNIANIQAQGSQSAYDRAIQSQQFGANLGMQGYGQALGAGAQLGQLGATQQGADIARQNQMATMGGQQQALEQSKINQAIQDYATQQQYPLMQLGVMSNMLRGLPMEATSRQTYAAQPSLLTQGVGTVGALGSLANVFKGREGGLPSEFKPATGIKSYRRGGVSDNVEGILYDMSPNDLEEYIKETSSPLAKRLAEQVLRDKVGKASGGIIAFQTGGSSNLPTFAQDTLTLPKGNLPTQREENESERTMREYRERIAAEEAKGPKPLERFKNYLSESQKASEARALDYSTPRVLTDPSAAVAPAPSPNAVVKDAVPASDMRTKEQIIADANKQNARVQADPNLSKEDKARLQKRHDEGVATVKADPNIGVKPPAPAPAGIKTIAPPGGTAAPPPPPGGTAPAPASTAAAPDAKSVLDGLPPELKKFFGKYLDKTPETVEEEIAKKEKYLGPDDSVQKERARLMAAKSNIQDEKNREFNMNAALFFAEMATKPGGVAFAAMTALKNTIPTFVASDKEKGKLFREIDKGLVDLDRAARLEKAGNYDAAAKIVAETAKNQFTAVGKILAFHQAVHVEKIRNEGKIKAAEIGLEGDRLKAKTQTDINRKQYFASLESDQKLLQKIEEEAKKSTDYAQYNANKGYLIKNINKKGTEEYKQKEDAVKKYEDDLETRTRPIREQINFYRKELGLDSSVDGERKKDTANNKLTMDGYVFPDQTSLEAYKAAKAKQKG